ncbi:diacylglycerol kinase family lipid kinase [bacterium]|nr:diacylglycerol kinase family lipid kinase [bacterium]
MTNSKRALLFYNKKAGQSTDEGKLKLIREHLEEHAFTVETEFVPQPSKQLRKRVRQAAKDGVDIVLAAGGDGTVSMVADAVVGTYLPLGVLPLGTGNLLAKELKNPVRLEMALELVTSEDWQPFKIDVIEADGHHYLMNISAGVSSRVMKETRSEEKQRYGVFAYLGHFFQQILGLKLQRFEISCDSDETSSFMASEVLVTNGRTIALDPLEWADNIYINDGKLDLFIIRAANGLDILRFIISIFSKKTWRNPIIHHVTIEKKCTINSSNPLPVQADGDAVGQTPINIKVLHQAVTIVTNGNENISKQ